MLSTISENTQDILIIFALFLSAWCFIWEWAKILGIRKLKEDNNE